MQRIAAHLTLVQQIDFHRLHPPDSAMDRGMLNILGALNQMERELTLERISAGLAAARTRGVRFGRPSALSDADRDCALNLTLTVAQAAKKIGVSKRHIYRLPTSAST